MPMGTSWASGSWVDGSWADGTWADLSPVICTPGPVGSVWKSGSWSATAWCQDTWAGAVTPPTPTPAPVVTEARRWPGPSTVIYRETDIIPAWQRRREDEEIVIL